MLNLKDKLSLPIFTIIAAKAKQLNMDVYIVGGYVRDLILNRNSKDIDFVCIGSGIKLAEALAREWQLHVNVFKTYGTAMLKYQNIDLEFVGARRESYRKDSRKPLVEDGSLQDDQLRRDFTINALAISLNEDNFGEVLDPFGGIQDLEQGLLRTPSDPSVTFSDDPLRMLRAIRFATQLNFSITDESLDAIKLNAKRLNIISKERIIEELNKIMMTPKPSVGFYLLYNTELLKYFLPELSNLRGIDVVEGKGHKDNFAHTLEVLDNIALVTDNLWLRWAALLHDIAKPLTKKYVEGIGWTFHGHEVVGAKLITEIFKRLKLPLDDRMLLVKKLVYLHMRPIILSESFVTDSAVRRLLFETGDDIDLLMQLAEADITSKNARKVERYMENFRIVRQKLLDIENKDRLRNWQPPVSGDVIMKTFGIKPCKEVGIIKTAIREAILEGEIQNSFEEAFQYMVQQGKSLGLKPI